MCTSLCSLERAMLLSFDDYQVDLQVGIVHEESSTRTCRLMLFFVEGTLLFFYRKYAFILNIN